MTIYFFPWVVSHSGISLESDCGDCRKPIGSVYGSVSFNRRKANLQFKIPKKVTLKRES
jgi:hypothetical protein